MNMVSPRWYKNQKLAAKEFNEMFAGRCYNVLRIVLTPKCEFYDILPVKKVKVKAKYKPDHDEVYISILSNREVPPTSWGKITDMRRKAAGGNWGVVEQIDDHGFKFLYLLNPCLSNRR